MIQFECEAIIFDLDGTLVDSQAVVERQWAKWALKHALDPVDVLELIHGRRAVESIHQLAPHLHALSEAAQLAEAEAQDTEGLTIIDGALEMLAGVPASAWGIATSGNLQIATRRIRHVELPMPAVLVTADDVEYGKPSPEPYLLAAARLNVAPEHCVVIEDTPAGVAAGRAAGMKTIAVTSTHPRYLLGEADVIAETLDDVSIEEYAPGYSEYRLQVRVR